MLQWNSLALVNKYNKDAQKKFILWTYCINENCIIDKETECKLNLLSDLFIKISALTESWSVLHQTIQEKSEKGQLSSRQDHWHDWD